MTRKPKKLFRVKVPKRTPRRHAIRRLLDLLVNDPVAADVIRQGVIHFSTQAALTGYKANAAEMDEWLQHRIDR